MNVTKYDIQRNDHLYGESKIIRIVEVIKMNNFRKYVHEMKREGDTVITMAHSERDPVTLAHQYSAAT